MEVEDEPMEIEQPKPKREVMSVDTACVKRTAPTPNTTTDMIQGAREG